MQVRSKNGNCQHLEAALGFLLFKVNQYNFSQFSHFQFWTIINKITLYTFFLCLGYLAHDLLLTFSHIAAFTVVHSFPCILISHCITRDHLFFLLMGIWLQHFSQCHMVCVDIHFYEDYCQKCASLSISFFKKIYYFRLEWNIKKV